MWPMNVTLNMQIMTRLECLCDIDINLCVRASSVKGKVS